MSTRSRPGRSSKRASRRCRVSDPDARQFRYRYLSLGQDVVLDPQGRIQISADYRERADLVKDVLIVGMQKMFEVWNAERWAHFERDTDRDAR